MQARLLAAVPVLALIAVLAGCGDEAPNIDATIRAKIDVGVSSAMDETAAPTATPTSTLQPTTTPTSTSTSTPLPTHTPTPTPLPTRTSTSTATATAPPTPTPQPPRDAHQHTDADAAPDLHALGNDIQHRLSECWIGPQLRREDRWLSRMLGGQRGL